MTDQETFVAAEQALTEVVNQIKDDQWDMIMSADFSTRSKDPVTLWTVINYHAYDDIWVPETLAGKTIVEVGDKYDGDLLGDYPKTAWQEIVASACAAVTAVTDLDRIVHLTYGDFSTRDYLHHIISFRGLRAVDLARAIGVDDQLPDKLAQSMYDMFKPDADGWRAMGVFGPEVTVTEDAPIQARLLGLTGRQP